MTLKDSNIQLHDMIRIMIDSEMAVMNGNYDNAYYLLGKLKIGKLDEFFLKMRTHVRDKIFEIRGEL